MYKNYNMQSEHFNPVGIETQMTSSRDNVFDVHCQLTVQALAIQPLVLLTTTAPQLQKRHVDLSRDRLCSSTTMRIVSQAMSLTCKSHFIG